MNIFRSIAGGAPHVRTPIRARIIAVVARLLCVTVHIEGIPFGGGDLKHRVGERRDQVGRAA